MTSPSDYQPSIIEPKWQDRWERDKVFQAKPPCKKPKFFALDMFPYPSGAGLHIGHPESYTAVDITARFKRAKGFNVLRPMGWDAFGLPAEQYAIKTGTHPRDTTIENTANFKRQIKSLGFYIDWNREINTTDPSYFKWTQWIFLQLFKQGLAYVDEKPVWWCPNLRAVLANEEIVDGKSEVGGHPVERKNLRQFVLRITRYADKLLKGLEPLDWPDSTKRQQTAWIGRSEGTEVIFGIERRPEQSIKVFTTRADTLFGATYMVLAPEHPLVPSLTTETSREAVLAYQEQAKSKSDLDRTDLAKDKSGVFTGSFAINPVNGQRIPIWISDYVLMSYGTGAIMAVPAHDERDYEFAQKFDLNIQTVVEPNNHSNGSNGQHGSASELPFTGQGRLVHSGDYTGLTSAEARKKLNTHLEACEQGKAAVQYRLRDWIFSRQRYWGEPIPVLWVSESDYQKVLANKASAFHENLPTEAVTSLQEGEYLYGLPLPVSALPLQLPEVESYQPAGSGESPLATQTEWKDVWVNLETADTVSRSGAKPSGDQWAAASRETNTMPQWAGSCWYYLRYMSPDCTDRFVEKEAEAYWKCPDVYIGGAEHAVLHLLYARFWHQVLFDAGLLSEAEPFKRLFHQGIILGEDGEKMSKSRGNVVNPDDIIKDYGADALRLYEMFLGPLEAMKPWNTKNIEGVSRFLRKVWRCLIDQEGQLQESIIPDQESNQETLKLLHQTIAKVSEDIESLRLNTAISQMMILVNHLQKAPSVSQTTWEAFLILLNPFAPHIAEELWERLGHTESITLADWPQVNESYLKEDQIKIIFQVNGKLRGEGLFAADASKDSILEAAGSHPKVLTAIEGKTIRKSIYVPGKIVNFVAN